MDEVWLNDGDVLADGLRVDEYINRRAVALVEYKDKNWRVRLDDPNTEVRAHLATAAGLPCYCLRYSVEDLTFETWPVNEHARAWLPQVELLSEIDFVDFQRSLRRLPPMMEWQREELRARLAD
jgi:hypothetical protein